MPELRYDIMSGLYSIIATERAKRPMDFGLAQKEEQKLPERDESCPFCPGNEHMTPPEVLAIRDSGEKDGPGWRVRIVPNKFPALVESQAVPDTDYRLGILEETSDEPSVSDASMYWEVPGVGAHEVVVESPVHNVTLGTHEPSHLATVLGAMRDRTLVLYDRKEIKYVQVFRNFGPRGGASLAHPHFQIIALPVLPPRLIVEGARQREYEARTGRCLVCDLIEREAEKDRRVVLKSEHFIVICPFASRYSFETMLVPRAHCGGFTDMNHGQIESLARALIDLFSAYEQLFSSLSYNIIFHSSPLWKRGREQWPYHFHVHVYPRLTISAGLELGSAVYINPTPPELATKQFQATFAS